MPSIFEDRISGRECSRGQLNSTVARYKPTSGDQLMVFRKRKIVVLIVALLLSFGANATCHAQAKFVTTRGKEFIAPGGRPLLLRGINLGNWLMPEGYMFKFKAANSPRLIQVVVNQLVGPDEAARFWKAYRDNYITDEDIKFIKQAGFNSVRVPFNYRLFVAEGETP